MKKVLRGLTIAGSDSGGCAGVQADLKTFAALGLHGMSVITSVTAQNTLQVAQTLDLPLHMIEAQIRAVSEDIGSDAVKTGMLPTPEVIQLVAASVKRWQLRPLVVDPVMVASSGDALAVPGALESFKRDLFPLADIVTPNLTEAGLLVGEELKSPAMIREAASVLYGLGSSAVIIKGGHSSDPDHSSDLFYDGKTWLELEGERIPTRNTHGSGCTFAAALASFLARGLGLQEAARRAKIYVSSAIRFSFDLGAGNGPLCHFFSTWPVPEAE